jgi:hypothetical protein
MWIDNIETILKEIERVECEVKVRIQSAWRRDQ